MAATPLKRPPRRSEGEYIPTQEAAQREIRRARLRRYRKHRRRVVLAALVAALALGFAVFHFCLDIVEARGGGMSPLIEGGSLVVCVKQSLLDALRGLVPEDGRHVDRGDLVLIRYGEDGEALMIRRVAALGGDTVDMAGGELILNQSERLGDAGPTDRVYPVTVPQGTLFVLGENRSVAIDSRLRAFQAVTEADVAGRPAAIIWPLHAMGMLG